MDINGWFQTWLNVITHPSEQVFEQERQRPQATLTTALIWMAIAAVISGIFALIQGLLFSASLSAAGGMPALLAQMNVPPEVIDQISTMPFLGGAAAGAGVGAVITSILGTLLGFLIGVGFFYLVARLLGGTGNFGRYAYLIATFSAPLSILGSLLGLVPVLGGCLGIVIAIYQIVLTYFATRVEHNLSQGRAITVVFIPIILGILLVLCIVFVLAGFLVSLRYN